MNAPENPTFKLSGELDIEKNAPENPIIQAFHWRAGY